MALVIRLIIINGLEGRPCGANTCYHDHLASLESPLTPAVLPGPCPGKSGLENSQR